MKLFTYIGHENNCDLFKAHDEQLSIPLGTRGDTGLSMFRDQMELDNQTWMDHCLSHIPSPNPPILSLSDRLNAQNKPKDEDA